MRRSKAQWKDMSPNGKLKYLNKFGLPAHFAEEHRQLPSWVVRRELISTLHTSYVTFFVYLGNPNIRHTLSRYEVAQPGGMAHGRYTVSSKKNFRKYVSSTDNYVNVCQVFINFSIVGVEVAGERLLCGDRRCSGLKDLKISPCRHMYVFKIYISQEFQAMFFFRIAVLATMHYSINQPFWKFYEKNNSARSLAQRMMQQRAADAGQKRRKGNFRSKNNDRRGALEQ